MNYVGLFDCKTILLLVSFFKIKLKLIILFVSFLQNLNQFLKRNTLFHNYFLNVKLGYDLKIGCERKQTSFLITKCY